MERWHHGSFYSFSGSLCLSIKAWINQTESGTGHKKAELRLCATLTMSLSAARLSFSKGR